MTFITKLGSASAQIGVLDELLTVSTWSLIEVSQKEDFDLSLRIGGRFKLLENFNENLMYLPELAEHHHTLMSLTKDNTSQSLELEFDQSETNTFYFSTPSGLYKFNRKEMEVTQMDTAGLGSPSSLSMSDRGYLLVGFTCGSIG